MKKDKVSNSSGSLRFKISLFKREMERKEIPVPAKRLNHCQSTSPALYTLLSEVHQQCVKRDQKGIFAKPVTEDIAPEYFMVISRPMDMGTINARLQSRTHYTSAGQYLTDLQQMYTNSMLYNPPDTVYYQRARKLRAFAEKQLTGKGLRKLAVSLLINLTAAEMNEESPSAKSIDSSCPLSNSTQNYNSPPKPSSPHQFFSPEPPTRKQQVSSSPCLTFSTTTTTIAGDGKANGLLTSSSAIVPQQVSICDLERSPPHLRESSPTSFLPSPILNKYSTSTCNNGNAGFERSYSSSTLSSRTSTRPSCDFEPVTISLNDSPDDLDHFRTQSPTSSTTSSTTTFSSRGGSGANKRYARTTVVATQSSSPTSFTPPKSASKKSTSRQPEEHETTAKKKKKTSSNAKQMHKSKSELSSTKAENAWSLTDHTHHKEILTQVKLAAESARNRLLARTTSTSQGGKNLQQIVILDTSQPGQLTAKLCPRASTQSSGTNCEEQEVELNMPANYPPALIQLLTGKPTPQAKLKAEQGVQNETPSKPTPGGYHGLMEQMTSQEVASLTSLSKLRYDVSAPIAADIHGPLSIFEQNQLMHLYDAYGCDVTAVEYVLSLLAFVEPIGPWARHWAGQQLDEATSGLHSQMLASFLHKRSKTENGDEEVKDDEKRKSVDWMAAAGFTIDPRPREPSSKLNGVENTEVEENPLAQPVITAPMAQLTTSTTTVASVRQTATVQPLPRLPLIISPAVVVSTQLPPTNIGSTFQMTTSSSLHQHTGSQNNVSYQSPINPEATASMELDSRSASTSLETTNILVQEPVSCPSASTEVSAPVQTMIDQSPETAFSQIKSIYEPSGSVTSYLNPSEQILDSSSNVLASTQQTIKWKIGNSDVNPSPLVDALHNLKSPVSAIPYTSNQIQETSTSTANIVNENIKFQVVAEEPSISELSASLKSEVVSVNQNLVVSSVVSHNESNANQLPRDQTLEQPSSSIYKIATASLDILIPEDKAIDLGNHSTNILTASSEILIPDDKATTVENLSTKSPTASAELLIPDDKATAFENLSTNEITVDPISDLSNPSEETVSDEKYQVNANLSTNRRVISELSSPPCIFKKSFDTESFCEIIDVPKFISQSLISSNEIQGEQATCSTSNLVNLTLCSPLSEDHNSLTSLSDINVMAKSPVVENVGKKVHIEHSSSSEPVDKIIDDKDDCTHCLNNNIIKLNNSCSVNSLHNRVFSKEPLNSDNLKTEPLSSQTILNDAKLSLQPPNENPISRLLFNTRIGSHIQEINNSNPQNKHKENNDYEDCLSAQSTIQEQLFPKEEGIELNVSMNISRIEPESSAAHTLSSGIQIESHSEEAPHSLMPLARDDTSNSSHENELNVDQFRAMFKSGVTNLNTISESSNVLLKDELNSDQSSQLDQLSSVPDFANASPSCEFKVNRSRTRCRSEEYDQSLVSKSANSSYDNYPTFTINDSSNDNSFGEQSFSPIEIDEEFDQTGLGDSPSPTWETSS